MIEIETKIKKVGSSYGMLIPKALIDCNILPVGTKIKIQVTKILEDYNDKYKDKS